MKKRKAYFLAGIGSLVFLLAGSSAKAVSFTHDRNSDYYDRYDNNWNYDRHDNSWNYDYDRDYGRNYGNNFWHRRGNGNDFTINNNGIPGVPDRVIARLLRLDVSDYRNRINNGKTLPDLIRDQGFTLDQFERALSDVYGRGRYGRGFYDRHGYDNGYYR